MSIHWISENDEPLELVSKTINTRRVSLKAASFVQGGREVSYFSKVVGGKYKTLICNMININCSMKQRGKQQNEYSKYFWIT